MSYAREPLPPLTIPLTLAGALPFIAGAIGAWRLWLLPFDPAYVTAIYAAIILSFLGGTHWGLSLKQGLNTMTAMAISNGLALLGWACVLAFGLAPAGVFLVLAAGFLIALGVDASLYAKDLISRPYFQLRQVITAIVVLCLLITAAAQWIALSSHT